MPDMSKLLYPENGPTVMTRQAKALARSLADSMRENVSPLTASALAIRLRDAEQMWRYFCRRDEMNAEIHLGDSPTASVRYSPITIAAERVVGYLALLYYGRELDYMTAIRPDRDPVHTI